MLLVYRTPAGQQVAIQSESELIMAMRTRRVTAETSVQLSGQRSWVPAGSLPQFAQWVDQALTVNPTPVTTSPTTMAPPPESTGAGQHAWFWLGIGMVLATVVVVGGVTALAPSAPTDWALVGALLGQGLALGLLLGALAVLVLKGPRRRHLWVLMPAVGLSLFLHSVYWTGLVVRESHARQAESIPSTR